MTPSAAMLEELETRRAELEAAGQPYALATVVRTLDATSAKPGAKALLDGEGTVLAGWVGGGCARGAIKRATLAALADGAPQFVSLKPEDLLAEEGVEAEGRLSEDAVVVVAADPCAAIVASILQQTPIQGVLPRDLGRTEHIQIISPALTNA